MGGSDKELECSDAEAKQALTGDRASDSQVASLAASGLWEHDDDAEHFFAKGLEIMQVARRKDESARRRYMPSKDKRAMHPAQGGDADGTRDDRGARGRVCGKRRPREPRNGHLQPGLQARCARRLSDSLREVTAQERGRKRAREAVWGTEGVFESVCTDSYPHASNDGRMCRAGSRLLRAQPLKTRSAAPTRRPRTRPRRRRRPRWLPRRYRDVVAEVKSTEQAMPKTRQMDV